jgi:ATP-binding cassette subfamily F protein uup
VNLGTNLAAVLLDWRREMLDPAPTLPQSLTVGAGNTLSIAGQSRHVWVT